MTATGGSSKHCVGARRPPPSVSSPRSATGRIASRSGSRATSKMPRRRCRIRSGTWLEGSTHSGGSRHYDRGSTESRRTPLTRSAAAAHIGATKSRSTKFFPASARMAIMPIPSPTRRRSSPIRRCKGSCETSWPRRSTSCRLTIGPRSSFATSKGCRSPRSPKPSGVRLGQRRRARTVPASCSASVYRCSWQAPALPSEGMRARSEL